MQYGTIICLDDSIDESQDGVEVIDSQDVVEVIDAQDECYHPDDDSQEVVEVIDFQLEDDGPGTATHMCGMNKAATATAGASTEMELAAKDHSDGVLRPLLLLHGMDDYDRKCGEGLNKIWKNVYAEARANAHGSNDLYVEALSSLGKLAKESTFPYISRHAFITSSLWMQLRLGVQVRSVQRHSLGEELMRWRTAPNQSVVARFELSHARIPEPNENPFTPTRTVNTTIPVVRSQEPVVDSRPVHASASHNRQAEELRQARLRRFDRSSSSPFTPSNQNRDVNEAPLSNRGGVRSSCSTTSAFDRKSTNGGGGSLVACDELGTWSCSACTFDNAPETTLCAMCATSRKDLVPQTGLTLVLTLTLTLTLDLRLTLDPV